MLGAIAGDIIGSVYEAHPIKSTDFPLFGLRSRFTDDTVLTVAVAYSVLEKVGYPEALRTFGRKYPNAGYGGAFCQWMFLQDGGLYNSWGNGSAMRVSPIGLAFKSIDAVLDEAEKSAAISQIIQKV